jgi:hypothetical protein
MARVASRQRAKVAASFLTIMQRLRDAAPTFVGSASGGASGRFGSPRARAGWYRRLSVNKK